jgi:hypothetical protein
MKKIQSKSFRPRMLPLEDRRLMAARILPPPAGNPDPTPQAAPVMLHPTPNARVMGDPDDGGE